MERSTTCEVDVVPQDSTPVTKDLEVAKLLLDEWKFRQQHCWSLLPRYGLAAVTVSISPYLKIELTRQLGGWAYVLPALGWGVALAATWLFLAEQYRSYSVLQHYRRLIHKERIHPTDSAFTKGLDRLKIRWITPSVFFISYTVLTVLNMLILCSLLR